MVKNKVVNLGVIRSVAAVLGKLNEQVVYVGGATVSLYADDPAAEDVRPTMDVDIMVNIVTFSELTILQERLAALGIHPAADAKITCRFRYQGILIDIMSTKAVGWAPSDPWFEPGFQNLVKYTVDAALTILIFPVAYFLATKFSAFHDRGGDPRMSKDFEDIVYVLDNRLNLADEIRQSPEDVRNYLKDEFNHLLRDDMYEAIACHLSPFSQRERLALLYAKIRAVTELVCLVPMDTVHPLP